MDKSKVLPTLQYTYANLTASLPFQEITINFIIDFLISRAWGTLTIRPLLS